VEATNQPICRFTISHHAINPNQEIISWSKYIPSHFLGPVLWGSWYRRWLGNLALFVHWTDKSRGQDIGFQALWRHESSKSVPHICDSRYSGDHNVALSNQLDVASLLLHSLWPYRWRDSDCKYSFNLANPDTETKSPGIWLSTVLY